MPDQKFNLIGPFRQLLTMRSIPFRGSLTDDVLEIIEDGWILVQDELIVEVGMYGDLKNHPSFKRADVFKLEGDFVGLPGFIDTHTHICFGGNRSKDYAMRIAGKSYQEIAAAGGGIWESVLKTREASLDALQAGIMERAVRHMREGVTTCEVKSGYGLNLESEIKMLEAISQANKNILIDLVPTCLAAHIKPRDFSGDNKEYLQYVLNEILPQVSRKNLAVRVDIFIEENAFDAESAIPFLQQAKAMGFHLTIHADQFTPSGSRVAVEVGADSADHLEASTALEVDMLSRSDVVPVVLPGASIGLGCPFAPARQLLDKGTSLVIASDWNPGSAPMGDLLLQAAVLGAYEKLSTAETFAAITTRAASVLRLSRGVLETNSIADIIAFPTRDYRDILYYQGKLKPSQVWKRGMIVFSEE